MAIDWVATMLEQADLVLKIATDVAKALDAPVTIEQASRLYRTVDQGAQDFDGIVDIMGEHDLEDAFIEAAEALEVTWISLSVAIANRRRIMRGLEPIDIAVEDD